MCRPPTEPSRQEEFEHIEMNFIYDQEERIRQLENYMQDITDEFMEFSSKVALRLKERIKESESKPRKIEKITKHSDMYGYCKNHKKTVKTGQTRTRERIECTRARSF
ncbi:hypothetical protein Tco_0042871 [Tanacetum coccineum]